MAVSVRALFVPRENPTSMWVGECARGKYQGLLCFPGGKLKAWEREIPALVRELCEETLLPPTAFEVVLLRPVELNNTRGHGFCFIVWVEPGFAPMDSDELVNWRLMTVTDALSSPLLLEFCKFFLVGWLERPGCPLKR